jgi:hypothetical protein
MDRALLIGINQYEYESPLAGCLNDVAAMYTFLKDKCGFPSSAIKIVPQAEANRAEIVGKLEQLAADTKSGDRVVFYFAGHGAQYPTLEEASEKDLLDELICPVDFDAAAGNGIRDRQFRRIFKDLPPDATFVWIADCCCAGDLTLYTRGITLPADVRNRINRARAAGVRPLTFARAAKELNLVLLAACAPDGAAHETMIGGVWRGLFTDTLLRRLSKPDGFTTTLRSVMNDVRQEIGRHQEPLPYGADVRINAPFPGKSSSVGASSPLPQTGAVPRPPQADSAAQEDRMADITEVKIPLCVAEYVATRLENGVVVVTGTGEHDDSGYDVELVAADHEPDAYFLLHHAPQQLDSVNTPFVVAKALTNVAASQKTIRIYDAQGTLDQPIVSARKPSPLADLDEALAEDTAFQSHIRGLHRRPRKRHADADSRENCRNCVLHVIEEWAGQEIISTNVTLEDLRGAAGCDPDALVDLADRLTVAGCGDDLRGTPLACSETVASVIGKVC